MGVFHPPPAEKPDRLERPGLAAGDRFLVEVGDRVLVHAMKIEPRAKAQERAAEADRRALEKHEFARHRQAPALGSSARITWPISRRPYSEGLTPSAAVRTRSSRMGPHMNRAQRVIASVTPGVSLAKPHIS